MEKIDEYEFSSVLKDVRASYRLIALYQRRVLDIVKYIGNHYDLNFSRGWVKFDNPLVHITKKTGLLPTINSFHILISDLCRLT